MVKGILKDYTSGWWGEYIYIADKIGGGWINTDNKSELNFQNYHFGWEDTINIAWGYCQY